ncbi:MAG: hypothetical protein FWD57_15550, partial [Polyangiaceae bacterium]|nr:hypothetical protein [Polyangiaceae bacterium]
VASLTQITLHTAWVEMELPGGALWHVDAPIPEDLARIWSRLGGDSGSWHNAIKRLETDRLAISHDSAGATSTPAQDKNPVDK